MPDQSLEVESDSRFDQAVLHTAIILFICTIALATVQITVRQINPFLNDLNIPTNSLPWTEPTARIILIVLTYLGAAVAARNHEHISIGIILDKLEAKSILSRRIIDIVVAGLCGVFMLIVFRGAVLASMNQWNTNLGGVGFVSAGMVYLGMSIGVGIAALYYGLELMQNIIKLKRLVTDAEEDSQ